MWIFAAVLFALFLVQNASVLDRGFGVSHDGVNGAVWGTGSRAMRELGIVESRFGGRAPEQVYANHPPGILAETYVAESVLGEHRWVTRLPAVLSSAAALALTVLVLRELGFGRGATALGVAVVGTSDMFVSFGAMLDTPVTSFPLSLAAVWIVARAHRGRYVHPVAAVAVGLGGAVSGWQSTVFCGLAVASVAWIGRDDQRWRTVATPLALGVGAGLALDLAWMRWVHGSLDTAIEQARQRSQGVDLGESIGRQTSNLQDLVPIAILIGGLGLALLLARRRHVVLVAATVLPTVLYALVFAEGGYRHHYWNYSILAGLALGAAAVGQEVLDRRPDLRLLGPLAIAALVGLSFVLPSAAQEVRDSQQGIPDLIAAAAEDGEGAPAVGLINGSGSQLSPISYEAGAPAFIIPTADDVAEAATERPAAYLLTNTSAWPSDVAAELLDGALATDGELAILPLDRAAEIFEAPREP